MKIGVVGPMKPAGAVEWAVERPTENLGDADTVCLTGPNVFAWALLYASRNVQIMMQGPVAASLPALEYLEQLDRPIHVLSPLQGPFSGLVSVYTASLSLPFEPILAALAAGQDSVTVRVVPSKTEFFFANGRVIPYRLPSVFTNNLSTAVKATKIWLKTTSNFGLQTGRTQPFSIPLRD